MDSGTIGASIGVFYARRRGVTRLEPGITFSQGALLCLTEMTPSRAHSKAGRASATTVTFRALMTVDTIPRCSSQKRCFPV